MRGKFNCPKLWFAHDASEVAAEVEPIEQAGVIRIYAEGRQGGKRYEDTITKSMRWRTSFQKVLADVPTDNDRDWARKQLGG